MPGRDEFLRQFIARHKDFEIAELVSLECPKHGLYTNNHLVQLHEDGSRQELPLSGCPKCNAEKEFEEMKRLYNEGIYTRMYKAAQIPAKYSRCMLRNFKVDDDVPNNEKLKTEARQKCLDFIEDRIRSIVLIGPTDRGKSHLLASMLKGCIQTGSEALYVVERKIYRDIHESYLGRKDLPTEGQIISKYSNIPVLGIDEMGRSSWTDHEVQTLYEIIDKRHVENRKTIMAGNITPAEFRLKFDESFERKLGAYQLECRWDAWGGKH